jgi:hypothetical protein
MALYVEQSRAPQRQQEESRDRGFEHLAAPALSTGLEFATFGPGPAAVKAVFKKAPSVFEGMNVANGTNLPSIKNVLVNDLIAQQISFLVAA